MSNKHTPGMALAIPLGLMAGLGPLCIDLYLPALPQLAEDLSLSSTGAQLSLTAGLAGLGLGQLIFGPLSDKYGRIRPLLVSLLILIVASIACAYAQSLPQLLAARLLQGLGGAGGAVLSRAIARDNFNGHLLTKFFAMLLLVNGLAPILAPILGSAMMSVTNWRGLFLTLSSIGLLLLLMTRLKVAESLKVENRSEGPLLRAWLQPLHVIQQRYFMGYCLTQGFMMAGMFAYIGASPFVLQQLYGMSPQAFSFCFAINGLGLILASQISSRLCPLFGEYAILKAGLLLGFTASLLLVICSAWQAPLPLILCALFFSISSNAIISTTASSLAMQSQGKRAGSASAVIGVTMFALGSLAIPIAGLGGTTALSMSTTIFGCFSLACLMFLLLAQRPQPKTNR